MVYEVGYGKPPAETRFQKGQSGNPRGRPRSRTLAELLGEALSRRSAFVNPDGSPMTRAGSIFAGLVGAAEGTELKAKRLLFEVLVKLQRANVGCPSDLYLPKIEVDSGDEAHDEIAAGMAHIAAGTARDGAARGTMPSQRAAGSEAQTGAETREAEPARDLQNR